MLVQTLVCSFALLRDDEFGRVPVGGSIISVSKTCLAVLFDGHLKAEKDESAGKGEPLLAKFVVEPLYVCAEKGYYVIVDLRPVGDFRLVRLPPELAAE